MSNAVHFLENQATLLKSDNLNSVSKGNEMKDLGPHLEKGGPERVVATARGRKEVTLSQRAAA